MMDTEAAAIRQKQELKRLEQQVEDMLLSPEPTAAAAATADYKQLIKELDYNSRYSSVDIGRIQIVQILCNIKQRQKDNKKLQKLINHYAIEHENVIALKP